MGCNLQRIVVVTLAGSLFLLATSLSAESYRWKDKDGNVHYGATVPAEYADQPYDVLNKQGIVIEHVEDTREPMKVRAERVIKEREPLISDEERQRQSDRLLVIQYQSEDDIQKALESAIAQLGFDTKLIHQSFESATIGVRDQIHLAADRQRAGKQIIANQQKRIDILYERIALDKNRIAALAGREAEIRHRFESELNRYRELVARQKDS